jgi:ATP citrate (pro-S)-lyase
MKRRGLRVPGIGHRIKSRDNRDKRVELLQRYARRHFPSTRYIDYAVAVEAYTLGKAANLVLNVDGCIGALFLDLLGSVGVFSGAEVDEIVSIGYLNGLFVVSGRAPRGLRAFGRLCCGRVCAGGRARRSRLRFLLQLARSVGLIGHALDQKRLGQGLYRHPWEDVLYTK